MFLKKHPDIRPRNRSKILCFCPHSPDFPWWIKRRGELKRRRREALKAHLIQHDHNGLTYGYIGCGEYGRCDPNSQNLSKYVVRDFRYLFDETDELLTEPFAELPQDVLNVIFEYYSWLRPWRLALLCKKWVRNETFHFSHINCSLGHLSGISPDQFNILTDIAYQQNNDELISVMKSNHDRIASLKKLCTLNRNLKYKFLIWDFMHEMTQDHLKLETKFKPNIDMNKICEFVRKVHYSEVYFWIYGKKIYLTNRRNIKTVEEISKKLNITMYINDYGNSKIKYIIHLIK